MSEVNTRDRVRSGYIRDSLGIVDIREKLREGTLEWIGHMIRKNNQALSSVQTALGDALVKVWSTGSIFSEVGIFPLRL